MARNRSSPEWIPLWSGPRLIALSGSITGDGHRTEDPSTTTPKYGSIDRKSSRFSILFTTVFV